MADFQRFLLLALPPAYMHFGKPEAWKRRTLLTGTAFIRLEIRDSSRAAFDK